MQETLSLASQTLRSTWNMLRNVPVQGALLQDANYLAAHIPGNTTSHMASLLLHC